MRWAILFILSLIRGYGGRDIFRYWDGKRYRYADPMEIYRGFSTHPTFSWLDEPKLLEAEENLIVLETSKNMAEAVRDVFMLRSFEQGGPTEKECHDIFYRFLNYAAAVKKNSKATLTLRQSTESPLNTQPTTNINSDSSSISIDSTSDERTTSTVPLPGH